MSQAIRTTSDRRVTSDGVTSRSVRTLGTRRTAVVTGTNISIRAVEVARVALQTTTRKAVYVQAEARRVSVALAGIRGPSSDAAVKYTHNQFAASSAWVVVHDLGSYPHVYVVISNEQVEARVTYPNNNSALVEFAAPQTGKAYCH